MTDAAKLPPGPFVTPAEAQEWADAAIASYLEACNAGTPEQQRKALAMLVSSCCGHMVRSFNGTAYALMMLEQTHAAIVASAGSTEGMTKQ